MPRKKNNDDIILEFKGIHGDKYNYSKVNYVNSKTKVIIGCPEHGDFEQVPNRHKQGDGCPKCSGTMKLTQEHVIEQFKEKHGENTYDYSKVNYVNSKTKVIIGCPKHGDFEQTPSKHKGGQGCKKCGNRITGDKLRKTSEDFIKEAQEKHGDKYNYSKVVYINTNEEVIIGCPIHGDFKQIPISHIKGFGCWKCGCEYRGRQNAKSKDIVIQEFKKKHGDKYDYSKVVYINNYEKVIIGCPIHGDFKQTPMMHLQGQRCPQCYGNIKWTTEKFIKEAKEKHGENTYDYSESICDGVDNPVIIKCHKHGAFKQTPWCHARVGQGCRRCSKANKSSKLAREWISYLLVSKPSLQHELSEEGEYHIPNTRYHADAYDNKTKTIYEFHGDFWHGNPVNKKPEEINPVCNKTFGELNKKTKDKENIIKKNGYNYVCIWEDEWINFKHTISKIQQLWRFKCSKV